MKFRNYFNIQHSTFNIQHSTFNIQQFLLNFLIVGLLSFLGLNVQAQQQPSLPPPFEWQVYKVDTVTNDSIPTTLAASWDSVRAKLTNLYSALNPASVPTGILIDKELPVVDPAIYRGLASDSIRLNSDNVLELFAVMQLAVIDTSQLLTEFDTTLLRPFEETDTIPFLFTFAHYNRLKPYAVDSGLIGYDTITRRFLNINPPPVESPFTTDTAIAGAPARYTFTTGVTVNFSFPAGLFVGNIGAPDSMSIDFDDGLGSRQVNFGDVETVTFADTNRIYNIATTVHKGNKSYRLESPVSSSYGMANLFYVPTIPLETTIISTPNRPDGEPGTSVCTLYVSKHPCHSVVTKPFIVLEGFEPPTMRARGMSEDLNDFLTRFREMRMPPANTETIESWMQREQYDLVYVDWNSNTDPATGGNPLSHGADHIRNNAQLVKEVINWVNAQKATAPELERAQNVVFAQSMGGLVGRVALREMEIEAGGTPAHDTKLYF
jgi:hypothetical protein